MDNNFEQLKEMCRVACHERNACKQGYEALMKTENIAQIMQVWRNNWDDIFKSKFADLMVNNIVQVYATAKNEFNTSDVWVNEPSERGLVIISNPTEPINVGGTARAYIFTPAEVTATDNAQVYCRTAGSKITLRGHAYCGSEHRDTDVTMYNFSKAQGQMRCTTYNAAEVIIQGGTLCDHGHRRIAAYGGTKVYSDTAKGIELGGQSRLYTLTEMDNG